MSTHTPTPPASDTGYESGDEASTPPTATAAVDAAGRPLAASLAADCAAGGHSFSHTPSDRAAVSAQRWAAVALLASLSRGALSGRGLDVTRVTLPLECFTPTTVLQRVGVELAHWPRLLARAVGASTPAARLGWVAAAAVSALRAAAASVSKPFNPVLGETWCGLLVDAADDDDDTSVIIHAEQVAHHPPVCVWTAGGGGWRAAAGVEWTVRAVRGGNSVKTKGLGTVTITFEDDGSTASREAPPVRVAGVLVGDRVVRVGGELNVTLRAADGTTLARALLHVGPPKAGLDAHPATSPLAGELRTIARGRSRDIGCAVRGGDRDAGALRQDEVAGIVCCGDEGDAVDVLLGSWLSHLDSLGRPPAPTTAPRGLFGRSAPPPPPPSPAARRLWDAMVEVPARIQAPPDAAALLPSDSRWRGDVRALAAGDTTAAATAKARLEDKQRADAAARREGRRAAGLEE